MLQREIVRFRQSDTAPNPLEVDYWIDLIANRYGGVIKYYDNLAQEWKRLIGLDGIIREVDPADYDNLGGFKLGYPENDHNYPVELDNEYRAYVNVPWTDTKYTLPPATTSKLGGVIVSTGLTVSSNGQLAVDSANVVTYWDNILNKPDYATRWPNWNEVTDKPKWHTVAYTGDYNDLFNLPDIEGMIADLVGSAPETLNTLKELADALGNDPNFSTTIMTLIGQKLDTSKYNQDKAILDQQISDLQDITEQHTEQIADNAEAIESKQDELISGGTIKTINGESILGPGNLQIRLFEVFSQDDLADGTTMSQARFNDLETAINRNWVIYIGPTDEGDNNEWIVCNEAKVTETGLELTWNTTEAINNDEVDYSVESVGGAINLKADTVTIDRATRLVTHINDEIKFITSGKGNRYLSNDGTYKSIMLVLNKETDLANGNGTVTQTIADEISSAIAEDNLIIVTSDNGIFPLTARETDDTLEIEGLCLWQDSEYKTIQYYQYVIDKSTLAITTTVVDQPHFTEEGDGNKYLGDNGLYQNVSSANLVTYTKPSDWSAITVNDSISEALGKLEVGVEQGNTKLDKITNYVTDIYPAPSIGATDYSIYYDVYNVDDDNITVSSCLITAATTTRAGVMTASDKQLLNNLDSRVTSVESSISSINSDITSIEGNITSIQGDITSIQGDITDIYDIIEGLGGGGGDPYVLPQATATTLGGIKIGYSDNGKYYGVQLDSNGNAYVYVPWTDSGGSGGDYELPIADAATLGGVMLTYQNDGIEQYYFDVNDNFFNYGYIYAYVPAATQSTPGVMSPEDKTKLDNMSSGGGGEGYVLPAATTTSLGGVMLGYPKTIYSDSTTYPLQLSQDDITADNRAFVSIPFATEEEGGLIKSEDKVYINTIQQSNPIVRIDEYYHSENFELRSYKVDETYSSTYIAACSITSAGVLRASSVNCLQTMTQSEYDDLGSYDSQTLYIIAD